MTGTGTQADPYIFTTADDLYALSTVGSSETYCRLGCDIDFNGTPYAENFEPITLTCKEFDGNGFCIRNIYANSTSNHVKVFAITIYHINPTLKNLRMENIELIGQNVSLLYSSAENYPSIYNCTFTLNIRRTGTSNPKQIITANTACTLSTFALRGNSKIQFGIINNSTINRCHFHLELEIETGDTTDGSGNAFFKSCTLTDSYVTGEITSASQLTGNSHMSYGSTFNNFYSALSYINQDIVYWKGTMSTPCFYDKELAGNRDFTSNRTYYGLTTAQCKNSAYLQSIGFIVAGEE